MDNQVNICNCYETGDFNELIKLCGADSGIYDKDNIEIAVRNNRVQFLYDLVSHNYRKRQYSKFTMMHCTNMAYKYNKLEILILFRSFVTNESIALSIVKFNMHIDCVKYFYRNGIELSSIKLTMERAIHNNNNAVVKFCLDYTNKPIWPLKLYQITKLIDDDNMECFDLMLQNNSAPLNICNIACKSLKFLKYFVNKDYDIDPFTCLYAIEYNNIECLDYLLNQGVVIGNDIIFCDDDNRFLREAIKYGHQDMFHYLIKLNCTPTPSLYRSIIKFKQLAFLDILLSYNIFIVEKDFIEMLHMITFNIFKHCITLFPCLNNENVLMKLIEFDKLEMVEHIYKSNTLTPKLCKIAKSSDASRCKEKYGINGWFS
jgi:ankyrin repeat protein